MKSGASELKLCCLLKNMMLISWVVITKCICLKNVGHFSLQANNIIFSKEEADTFRTKVSASLGLFLSVNKEAHGMSHLLSHNKFIRELQPELVIQNKPTTIYHKIKKKESEILHFYRALIQFFFINDSFPQSQEQNANIK